MVVSQRGRSTRTVWLGVASAAGLLFQGQSHKALGASQAQLLLETHIVAGKVKHHFAHPPKSDSQVHAAHWSKKQRIKPLYGSLPER